jgi:hypothetical protein
MLNVIGVIALTAMTILFIYKAAINLYLTLDAAAFGQRGVFNPLWPILAGVCFVLALIVGAG